MDRSINQDRVLSSAIFLDYSSRDNCMSGSAVIPSILRELEQLLVDKHLPDFLMLIEIELQVCYRRTFMCRHLPFDALLPLLPFSTKDNSFS